MQSMNIRKSYNRIGPTIDANDPIVPEQKYLDISKGKTSHDNNSPHPRLSSFDVVIIINSSLSAIGDWVLRPANLI